MKIKKSTFVIVIIVAVVASSILTASFVNPFGAGGLQDVIIARMSGSGEDLSRFNKALYFIKEGFYEDVDEDELTTAAIKGMTDSLHDDYSEYMTDLEADEFMDDVNGNYSGVGLYITRGDDGLVTVIAPLSGSPAYEAHITTGDKLLAVDGEPLSGDDLTGAANRMKGEVGTTVKVSVLKADSGATEEIELTRANITIEVAEGKMLENEIGYIAVSQFTQDMTEQFMNELNSLREQGANSLIIDLRGNPGGYMDVAVQAADLFMDEGVITYTEDKGGKQRFYRADGDCIDIPTVILINGGSASASEIFTSALHDSNRAYVIGEKSYGKGVVQEVLMLDGGLLKLTTARYFTPSGVCLNGIGIEPDLTVEMSYDDYYRYAGGDGDVQLDAAVEYLKTR